MQQPVPACLLIWSDLLPLLAGFPMAYLLIDTFIFNRPKTGTTGWFSGFAYSNPCHLQPAQNWNWGYSKHHWYGALGKFLLRIAGIFSRICFLRQHDFHQILLDTPVYAKWLRIKLPCFTPCVFFPAWCVCQHHQVIQRISIHLLNHSLATTPANTQSQSIHQSQWQRQWISTVWLQSFLCSW